VIEKRNRRGYARGAVSVQIYADPDLCLRRLAGPFAFSHHVSPLIGGGGGFDCRLATLGVTVVFENREVNIILDKSGSEK
jgi:hypothetical protein